MISTKIYDNQEIIDEEEEKVKEIDPNFRIGGYGIVGNTVISLEMTFPLKGNAKKIKALEDAGWERDRRFKNHAWRLPYCSKEGLMYQRMIKRLT